MDALPLRIVVSLKLGLEIVKKTIVNDFVQAIEPRSGHTPVLGTDVVSVAPRHEHLYGMAEDPLDGASVVNAFLGQVPQIFRTVAPSASQHGGSGFAPNGDDTLVIAFGFALPSHHGTSHQVHRFIRALLAGSGFQQIGLLPVKQVFLYALVVEPTAGQSEGQAVPVRVVRCPRVARSSLGVLALNPRCFGTGPDAIQTAGCARTQAHPTADFDVERSQIAGQEPFGAGPVPRQQPEQIARAGRNGVIG